MLIEWEKKLPVDRWYQFKNHLCDLYEVDITFNDTDVWGAAYCCIKWCGEIYEARGHTDYDAFLKLYKLNRDIFELDYNDWYNEGGKYAG